MRHEVHTKRRVVFFFKLRKRGGREDNAGVGKTILPVKRVTTVEGRVLGYSN